MSSQNGDEDVDIYDDLPDFNLEGTIQKLEVENKVLSQKVKDLSARVVELETHNKELSRLNKNLKANISALVKTVQAEIQRKDSTIAELRQEREDLFFRRQKPNTRGSRAQPPGRNQYTGQQVDRPGNFDDRTKVKEEVLNTKMSTRQSALPATRKRAQVLPKGRSTRTTSNPPGSNSKSPSPVPKSEVSPQTTAVPKPFSHDPSQESFQPSLPGPKKGDQVNSKRAKAPTIYRLVPQPLNDDFQVKRSRRIPPTFWEKSTKGGASGEKLSEEARQTDPPSASCVLSVKLKKMINGGTLEEPLEKAPGEEIQTKHTTPQGPHAKEETAAQPDSVSPKKRTRKTPTTRLYVKTRSSPRLSARRQNSIHDSSNDGGTDVSLLEVLQLEEKSQTEFTNSPMRPKLSPLQDNDMSLSPLPRLPTKPTFVSPTPVSNNPISGINTLLTGILKLNQSPASSNELAQLTSPLAERRSPLSMPKDPRKFPGSAHSSDKARKEVLHLEVISYKEDTSCEKEPPSKDRIPCQKDVNRKIEVPSTTDSSNGERLLTDRVSNKGEILRKKEIVDNKESKDNVEIVRKDELSRREEKKRDEGTSRQEGTSRSDEKKRDEETSRKEGVSHKEGTKRKGDTALTEEILRKEEVMRKEETSRREVVSQKEDTKPKGERARAEEVKSREEALRREEVSRMEDLKRKEDRAHTEEVKRKEETLRREEVSRKEDLKRKEDRARAEEVKRKEETLRREEVSRKEDLKRKEDRARAEEVKRKEERLRREEVSRKEDLKRKEDRARAEEVKREEETLRREEVPQKKDTERKEEASRQEVPPRREDIERKEGPCSSSRTNVIPSVPELREGPRKPSNSIPVANSVDNKNDGLSLKNTPKINSQSSETSAQMIGGSGPGKRYSDSSALQCDFKVRRRTRVQIKMIINTPPSTPCNKTVGEVINKVTSVSTSGAPNKTVNEVVTKVPSTNRGVDREILPQKIVTEVVGNVIEKPVRDMPQTTNGVSNKSRDKIPRDCLLNEVAHRDAMKHLNIPNRRNVADIRRRSRSRSRSPPRSNMRENFPPVRSDYSHHRNSKAFRSPQRHRHSRRDELRIHGFNFSRRSRSLSPRLYLHRRSEKREERPLPNKLPPDKKEREMMLFGKSPDRNSPIHSNSPRRPVVLTVKVRRRNNVKLEDSKETETPPPPPPKPATSTSRLVATPIDFRERYAEVFSNTGESSDSESGAFSSGTESLHSKNSDDSYRPKTKRKKNRRDKSKTKSKKQCRDDR